MSKITLSFEVETELLQWFEEYCEDGLLNIEEELSAVVGQFLEDQIDESGVKLDDKMDFAEEVDDEEEEDDFESDLYEAEEGE